MRSSLVLARTTQCQHCCPAGMPCCAKSSAGGGPGLEPTAGAEGGTCHSSSMRPKSRRSCRRGQSRGEGPAGLRGIRLTEDAGSYHVVASMHSYLPRQIHPRQSRQHLQAYNACRRLPRSSPSSTQKRVGTNCRRLMRYCEALRGEAGEKPQEGRSDSPLTTIPWPQGRRHPLCRYVRHATMSHCMPQGHTAQPFCFICPSI